MTTTVAIPTYNNTHQLVDALVSMVRNTDFSGRILVINNGEPGSYETVQGAVPYEIDWLDAGKNLGWMGGVNEALRRTETEFITMMNDDVLFPPANLTWWSNQLRWFDMPNVGGVGPTSNYVAGVQNAFLHIGHPVVTAPYLIGMCATYRTDVLKALGGLDESLPGGDDLDLAIRIKATGRNALVADRRCYLHHIGSQTGQRLFPGQWDSQKHQTDTYNALIRKHGLLTWFNLMNEPSNDFLSFCIPRHAVRVTRAAMQSQDETIDGLFAKAVVTPSDVNGHIDLLRRYASGCEVVCEFGVEDCTTTAAFLKARPRELHSYDIKRHENVSRIEKIAEREGVSFTFHEASTLDVEIPECDMLYVDDLHTYTHVKAELEKHAGRVRKYMAFHDTECCDEFSEDRTKPGIWDAIAEFLRAHSEWRLIYHTEDFAGLAILMHV